ncbi:hypothetical protein DY000_02015216 [Brassica cretica]|uniref:Uncharacterized protein n=1 Tax=Brassica cretica TaxID=69181 RepID=A0ABQ7CY83_BRACR|nr:hypothetical protein DY000_02015216 [Brassica cretica]
MVRGDAPLIGAGRLAHSAGNSWWSAHLSWEECSGPKLRLNQNMRETTHRSWKTSSLSWEQLVVSSPQLRGVFRSEPVWLGPSGYGPSWWSECDGYFKCIIGSYGAVMVDFFFIFPCLCRKYEGRRQKTQTNIQRGRIDKPTADKEKEIEKEKETAPGDRNLKVRDMEALILGLGRIKELMTVHGFGRTDHDQDPYGLGRYSDYGNLLVATKTKSRRGKDAAGASGTVGQDGAVQTAVLPAGTIATTVLQTQEGLGNNETGLPVDPILPTETRVDAADGQQEQVREDDVESSNAENEDNLGIGPDNVGVDGVGEVAQPSMRDILEAMKLMGAQLVTLTQAFTPLVNPPVGQVTPPVRAAAQVAGSSEKKRKRDSVEEGQTSSGRYECPKCGRYHGVGGQLTSAGRSVPVRTSVVGSERLWTEPVIRAWRLLQVHHRLDQGLSKGSGIDLGKRKKREKPPRAVMGRRLWGNCPFWLSFWQKDKEKEIEEEKETAPGDRNPKVRDTEALILGLGRIKELMTVHGFGRTDHDQDPYSLGKDMNRDVEKKKQKKENTKGKGSSEKLEKFDSRLTTYVTNFSEFTRNLANLEKNIGDRVKATVEERLRVLGPTAVKTPAKGQCKNTLDEDFSKANEKGLGVKLNLKDANAKAIDAGVCQQNQVDVKKQEANLKKEEAAAKKKEATELKKKETTALERQRGLVQV